MAGLQYNFFPTDFFFPKTVTRDSNPQQVLLTTTNDHETEDTAQPKQLTISSNSTRVLKAIPSSSSLALAPIRKQNQEAPSQ